MITKINKECMRLYFDCAIKSAYMQKYFNVKIKVEFVNEAGVVFDTVGIENRVLMDIEIENTFKKYYVSKESESIFEQKEGDIGIAGRYEEPCYFGDYCKTGLFWIDNSHGLQYKKEEGKTIMRDNKHFFSALRESA